MNNAQIVARIQEGLEQAQRGDFISDGEMEEFFCQHACLFEEGNVQLVDADEVMKKYRK